MKKKQELIDEIGELRDTIIQQDNRINWLATSKTRLEVDGNFWGEVKIIICTEDGKELHNISFNESSYDGIQSANIISIANKIMAIENNNREESLTLRIEFKETVHP